MAESYEQIRNRIAKEMGVGSTPAEKRQAQKDALDRAGTRGAAGERSPYLLAIERAAKQAQEAAARRAAAKEKALQEHGIGQLHADQLEQQKRAEQEEISDMSDDANQGEE